MPVSEESVELAVSACQAADDKKAEDLTILEVGDILGVTEVFAVVTAGSDRQLKAIVDAIEERLRDEHQRKPRRSEGTPASGWMLLDFEDMVCHLFSREQRSFYALDRLWADVPRREPLTGEPLPSATTQRTSELTASPADANR